MITVVDQVRPWLTPRKAFASSTHSQLRANISRNGTGVATSQPATGLAGEREDLLCQRREDRPLQTHHRAHERVHQHQQAELRQVLADPEAELSHRGIASLTDSGSNDASPPIADTTNG